MPSMPRLPTAPERPSTPAFEPSTPAVNAWRKALRTGDLERVQRTLAADGRWGRVPLLNVRTTSDVTVWTALHQILATPDYGTVDKRLAMLDAVIPFSNVRWDDEHPGATTPLMMAATSCQVAVIRRLLPLSNPRATTVTGTTALMVAAGRNQQESVQALLPVSDPQACDQDGRTAVMLAAAAGGLAVVNALWSTAVVGQADRNGDTVVMLAARKGLAPIVQRWLNDPGVGRDGLFQRNHQGETVLDAWHHWANQPFHARVAHPPEQALLSVLRERYRIEESEVLRDDLRGIEAPPRARTRL